MKPQDLARTHAAAFTRARPWSAQEFCDLLENRFTHVVGNERSFAVIQVIADQAELLTIATHPAYQRQGLARQCMKDWHNKAKKLGATHTFLDVAADNLPAISLYQSCGYKVCGLRKGYYLHENNQKLDAIQMECRLI